MGEVITGSGLFIGQIVIFVSLVAIVIFFLWYVRKLQLQLIEDRLAAIEEVKRSAAELARRTEEIAEEVKNEALNVAERLRSETTTHARVTAEDLNAKMAELLKRFNEAGAEQTVVQEIVTNTETIVQEEFNRREVQEEVAKDQISTMQKTTKDQINEIQKTTKAIDEKVSNA